MSENAQTTIAPQMLRPARDRAPHADCPADQHGTLLLLTLHPPPPTLETFYGKFRAIVNAQLNALGIAPEAYLLYDPSALHCTLAALHPGSACKGSPSERYQKLVTASKEGARCPRREGASVLLSSAKVFPDGVGVLLFDDSDAGVGRTRTWLRAQLRECDRAAEKVVKLPSIVHCTVFRWSSAPCVDVVGLQGVFDAAFRGAGGRISVPLQSVVLVTETRRYMRESVVHGEVCRFGVDRGGRDLQAQQ